MEQRRKEKIDEGNFYRSYIKILPDDFSQYPQFFTDDELLHLDGSPLQKVIQVKIESAVQLYHTLCNEIVEFK